MSSKQGCFWPDHVEAITSTPNRLTDRERGDLAESVVGWCKKLAREHCAELARNGRHFEREELEGEAILASVQASHYWDKEQGVRFITYAGAWVRTALISHTDPRTNAQAIALEFPERQESREDGPEYVELAGPDAVALRLLGNLAEPTRTIVRLVVFDKLSPARVAVQLGLRLTEIRLAIRNALNRFQRVAQTNKDVEAMLEASGS